QNRKIYHPRGKVLGGCSSTNAMAYVRGHAADYNQWASLGNTGWRYEDVLPYFIKSENNEQFQNNYHGQNGPLNVTHALRHKTELAQTFIEACAQAGIVRNDDFNGAKQEGAGLMQFTIKDAKRCSTADAFLKPVLSRDNLTVYTGVHVKQILIEKDEATGVEYFVRDSSCEKVFARKEVILCGGAFASPQLLMLSGIGPKDVLAKHHIEVKKELPGVGQNLQDHLFFAVSSLCKQPISNNHWMPWHKQAEALLRYALFKTGPLTLGPLEACAFTKSDPTQPKPDLQFQFTPTNAGNDYTTDVFDLNTFPRADGYTILPTQVNPKSRGYLTLASADPFTAPIIDPRYLSEEVDRETMVKGAKIALQILEADAWSPYRIKTHCPAHRDSDEALLDHIQRSAECVYHPVGTCKMGMDEMAVVNDQLQVYGIGKLRVVDASVMPTLTSGNTNAPTIMIAEKAGDLIKEIV
ncbi:MAG: GMC family oxidoreductase N-terminal domain-containing protein, partial [Cyclobacteriaceae bacterium]|nr:GMC family oxidoreductase N-terminal domain-containing protein [Cyclobacteriaceae bacterium]